MLDLRLEYSVQKLQHIGMYWLLHAQKKLILIQIRKIWTISEFQGKVNAFFKHVYFYLEYM